MSINPSNLANTATLTFDDEFNSLSLWNGAYGSSATGTWLTYWQPQGGILRPDELQWYINNNYAPTSSVQPWTVNNGILSLTAAPAPLAIQPYINNYQYTSGFIDSAMSFTQTYGYFEMKAELPAGQGFHPAFWLLNLPGAPYAEIDVVETIGSQPTQISGAVWNSTSSTAIGNWATVPDTSTGFHTYGLDWEPDYITWYFDGKAIGQTATPPDMNHPMMLVANVAVGGGWPGSPDSSTPFPASMQIDYIRAYSSNPYASAAPVITSFSPDSGTVGDGITNANQLTLAGTAVAGDTVQIFDGTTLLGSATANSSGAWTYTTAALSNGAHSLTATATDVAGNTSAVSAALSVTVDTVAPIAPVIATDAIVNTNEVMLTGTAEANSTVNVFEGTTQLGTATADGSGAWSFTTGQLSSGDHAFTATATDAAGNTSLASLPIDPTIGMVAPTAPSIASFSPDTGKVGDGITDAAVLTLTGTAEANSTVAVFDGTTQLGTATVNTSGAWNFTTGTLANGTHTFTATDTDAAGTISAASSTLAITVDTIAPTPAFTNLVHNSNGNVTLSGTSEANSTVSIYDGTIDLGTVTTAANGTWSFTTANLSNALHNFTLKAADVAGNVGSGSNVALYDPANHATLNLGPANDLVTVLGKSDTFVFGSSLGKDVITGFQATGSNHDILQFSHNTFSSFAAVLAHAAQVGSDVVITVDPADTVTLHNVHLSSLQKNDIHIV